MLRVLLFIARPRTTVLGSVPNSNAYRRVDQYPAALNIPGVLILAIDAPIYFANAGYLRERLLGSPNLSQILESEILSKVDVFFLLGYQDGLMRRLKVPRMRQAYSI